jgi:hypothetical protein
MTPSLGLASAGSCIVGMGAVAAPADVVLWRVGVVAPHGIAMRSFAF